MKSAHRVVWTKGMFLNPQHFQTQDQFAEELLQFHSSASNYANWGVTALRIDRDALTNGVFRLLEARGLMPDGMPFRMPDIDELPASREVDEFFQPGEKHVDVYLAIREPRLEAPNVTMSPDATGAPPDTRFVVETRTAVDANEGVESKPVQVAKRNFRLLFGPEHRHGFTCLRLARVARDAAGQCLLEPTFIAPCLDIAHSEYLMGLLRRQVEILAAKSRLLSSSRRERGKAVAGFSSSETTDFWLLHTANSCLPELRHIWKVRQGHPENAYVAMLRLAGALTTFSFDAAPEDLPDYDHGNLGACFTALDARIRDMIERNIPKDYVTIPLTGGEGLVWKGTVPDDRYFRGSQFYLAASANMETGELIQKVPRLLKIAAPDDLQRLIDKALAGITLTHTSAPMGIPMTLGNQYFALGMAGPLWERVVALRNLAVYAPAEIKLPQMEILIALS
jgi:type VI secretion system protein ImpJ